jgi:hypothetical protein
MRYEEALNVYGEGTGLEPSDMGTLSHTRDGGAGEQFEDKVKLMSNRAECLLRLNRFFFVTVNTTNHNPFFRRWC